MIVTGNDAVERTILRSDRRPLDIGHIDVAQYLHRLTALAGGPVGDIPAGVERFGKIETK